MLQSASATRAIIVVSWRFSSGAVIRVVRIVLVAFAVVWPLRSTTAAQPSPAAGIKVCQLLPKAEVKKLIPNALVAKLRWAALDIMSKLVLLILSVLFAVDVPVARVDGGLSESSLRPARRSARQIPGGRGSENIELRSYGSCRNLTPNYLNQVTLSRWAGNGDRLNIAVSLSANRSLSGIATVAAHYLEGARFGAEVWATSLKKWTRSFLDVHVRRDDPSAQIKITLEDSASPSNDRAEAETRVQYGRIGARPVITHATIVLHRGGRSGLRAAERLLAQGTWSRWHFESLVGELVAHEMGHALGIRGHSGDPADLMHSGGRADPRLDPGSWITRADVNTLWLAYCGESTGSGGSPR